MLPVIVCPGCGLLYSLPHVPGKPYQECAACGWPFDPASAETATFDTTDTVQPEKGREPMRAQHRKDAQLARGTFGYLLESVGELVSPLDKGPGEDDGA